MSPEVIQKHIYDYRVDIWSLGVLLYELLHGKVPFEGSTVQEKFKNILTNTKINYDYQISDKAKDLIELILKKNPNERIQFFEIFEHPWVQAFEKIFNINLKTFIYQSNAESPGFNSNSRIQTYNDSIMENHRKPNLQININLTNRGYMQDSKYNTLNTMEDVSICKIPDETEKTSQYTSYIIILVYI